VRYIFENDSPSTVIFQLDYLDQFVSISAESASAIAVSSMLAVLFAFITF